MNVVKKFEFNDGVYSLFLITNKNQCSVSVCERFDDGWLVVRDFIVCDMICYDKALRIFSSVETFINDGNYYEDFRVTKTMLGYEE
jgi:hypothetical protein